MQDFTTTIQVSNSTEEVYKAINNVRAWWQGEIIGQTDTLNNEFTYQMKDVHFSKQKIVELIPNKKVVWKVTESSLKFPIPTEWTGSTIEFLIENVDGNTQVKFTHKGLVPAFECYNNCSWAWGQLIQTSLKSLIETGQGVNVFN
ncbi:SRPBCC domain-containing protein [Ferruginibacter lapsinanis]|uniref:SRPBCC family protein n=1 Tax=Ferruginibacter lapsinanis TaxID=563172 RepID=UPI001E43BAA8|nr:SRPBCC domain-containing protein [Ferruginibacter lapsinanis]UEG49226.1 SRPBCC domain-containing protein [Ferruginibacter lapsinanis]